MLAADARHSLSQADHPMSIPNQRMFSRSRLTVPIARTSRVNDLLMDRIPHRLTPLIAGKHPSARLDLTMIGNHSLVLQAPVVLGPHA